MGTELQIEIARLRHDIETLAKIGRQEDHGLYRMALSDEDMQGRAWLQAQCEAAGLATEFDGAANLIARLPGQEANAPAVVTGSHIDTVPGAGHLDGALGVLSALECLRVFRDCGVKPKRPIELISFTDEEGRFGGMFGSQAVAGVLTPEMILTAKDLDGVTLSEMMEKQGYNAMHALHAARKPETIKAFIELHIEQGPVLDRMGLHVGVVDAIVGLFRWNVRLIGEAGHAGATPMDMRKDAFQGLAAVAASVSRVLDEYGSPHSVATIGRVELTPGAANVVPGRVDFALEVRDTDSEVLSRLSDAFRRVISAIGRRHDLMFEYELVSELPPTRCDEELTQVISDAASGIGIQAHQMPSGAAHDTQMMRHIAPAAMIFVPSRDGRSHSPAEWTAWESIEAGANVLLHTLHRLAME